MPDNSTIHSTGSGVQGRQGRWEIHHDPYGVTAVWFRNHHHGGWITVPWVHRGIVGQPFSAAIYEHVRRQATTGRTPVGDDYIARRVAELLTPTGDSPRSDADRRAAAQHANRPTRCVCVHPTAHRLIGDPGPTNQHLQP